jgi:hypothetical protein
VHEKRAYSRINISAEAVCTTEGGAVVVGKTRDLSVGGAYIESQDIPAFGSKVVCAITLPGQGEVRIQAIVRWTKPDGFGLQFQLLGAKETYAITKLASVKQP